MHLYIYIYQLICIYFCPTIFNLLFCMLRCSNVTIVCLSILRAINLMLFRCLFSRISLNKVYYYNRLENIEFSYKDQNHTKIKNKIFILLYHSIPLKGQYSLQGALEGFRMRGCPVCHRYPFTVSRPRENVM